MRNLMAIGLIAMVAGCDGWAPISPWSDFGWEDDDVWWDTGWNGNMDPYLRGEHEGFNQQSSLWTNVKGVTMADNGSDGVAGMSWAACQFETISGNINVDIDPDSDDEEHVDDGQDDDGTTIVLSSTNSGVQVTHFDDWDGYVSDRIDVPGVQEARFWNEGIVASRNNGTTCTVRYIPGGDIAAGAGMCLDLTVDADNGRAFLAIPGDIKLVRPNGNVTSLGHDADLVEWDDATNLLYTAVVGGVQVRALQADGDVSWTTGMQGTITSMAVLGGIGQLVVGLDTTTGGALVVLDGATGSVLNDAETTGPAREMSASADGHTLAVITDSQTHLIRID